MSELRTRDLTGPCPTRPRSPSRLLAAWAVSVVTGSILAALLRIHPAGNSVLDRVTAAHGSSFGLLVVLYAVPLGASVVLFLVLSRPLFRDDGETHCRGCGHILRGLRQPVCPECGRRI